VAALAATVLLFGGVLGGEAAPASSLPTDGRSLVTLGREYQQRARETADASYLTRSETALRRALRLDTRDAAATEGLAALALSRHDFRGALVLARRARTLAPDSARPLALLGDALVELGRYRAAFAAYDAFALRKPGLNAYARVAYGRELLGDRNGALEAMRLAVAAAPGRGEPTAWARVELGKLHSGRGDLDAARREYRAALAAFPGYVYALEGLAHVEAAGGRLDDAIALAREAAETAPLPQFVITLGDLYLGAGRAAAAAEQYELLAGIRRLLAGNGVRSELELALFDADRGLPAVREARRAHAERPSVQADDVLGWALVREGRCAEGLRYARRALRLGTRDALLFFHRGMAERCLGRDVAAARWFERAIDLNPHFSLRWAPLARRYAG
jgi:tetratricopeptide (TPR) repeat protein